MLGKESFPFALGSRFVVMKERQPYFGDSFYDFTTLERTHEVRERFYEQTFLGAGVFTPICGSMFNHKRAGPEFAEV